MSKRNVGLDLLKCIAMLMIVSQHVLMHGGVIDNCPYLSVKYYVSWLLHIITFGGGNIYAIISGYVGIDHDFKMKNIILLWLEVLFYSVGITILFICFLPYEVGIKDVINSCLPVSFSYYWYFTQYVGMCFFIPAINVIVKKLERKQLELILCAVILLFSVIPTILGNDPFISNSGFSALWLGICYLFGAYIKEYHIGLNINKWKLVITGLCLIALTCLTKFIPEFVCYKSSGEKISINIFERHISMTIILFCIVLVILFSRVKIQNKSSKIITKLSGGAFAVYLIHTHPLVWNYCLTNVFSLYAENNTAIMVVQVLITVIAIFVVCELVEEIRYILFRLVRMETVGSVFEKKAWNLVDKVSHLFGL